MVGNVVVDDTDTQYIAYAGSSDWTVLTGSSRQWESTVHSTRTYGAAASFQFLGTGFVMYGTVPAGSGTVYVDITIDGGPPTRVTRTSGSVNVYDNVFYQSPVLHTDSVHIIVFTNRGNSTDTSFQFDRVELLSVDAYPTILSNGNQTQPTTSSSGSSPATNAGQVTSTSTGMIDATGKHHSLSVGAIAGIAIGALVLLALSIASCFILKRLRGRSRGHETLEDNQLEMRQSPRSLYVPTPYPTEPQPLLIPPSKEDRSPHVINGATPESNNHLSTSNEANIRAASVTRTEIRLQDPSTSAHPPASNGGGDTSGPSIPPGLNDREENQRQSTFEAPPAYQSQGVSSGGPRT